MIAAGNKIITASQKPLWSTGVRSGLKFDGVNDYIDLTHVSEAGTPNTFDRITAANQEDPWTYHIVGKTPSLLADDFGEIIYALQEGGFTNRFILQITKNNFRIQIQMGSSGFTWATVIDCPHLLGLNEIFAVTFVKESSPGEIGYRADKLTVYKNYGNSVVGAPSIVADNSGLAPATHIGWIGGGSVLIQDAKIRGGNGTWFQVTAFDKALSAAEVASLQNYGLFAKVPPSLEANVLANWDFSNRHGAKVRDTVGLYNSTYPAHDGTANNMQTGLGSLNQWVDLSGNPILR